MLVDNRPVKVRSVPRTSLTRPLAQNAEANSRLKIEVVVASADLIPAPKTLGQRVSQPKVQPKSAAADKGTGNVAKAAPGAKVARKPRRGRNSRPAKKTAEELDSEMADYFDGSGRQAAGTNGTAPAPANGDAPMEDDIM